MAGEPAPALILAASASPQIWRVRFRDAAWITRLRWPDPRDLAQIRWRVEDSDRSDAMAVHAARSDALAARVATRLWDGISLSAPPSCADELARYLPRIEVEGASPNQLTALSLLGADRGAPSGVTVRLGAEASAAVPLRLLLITARPLRAEDAPYLGLAQPLGAAAADAGIRLERVHPARRRALVAAVAAAVAECDPYTMLVFDGHGVTLASGTPCIALESDAGPAFLDAQEVAECLGPVPPALIVLAACRTAYQDVAPTASPAFAEALARCTGSEVVAMHYDVAPWAAAECASVLLAALGRGADVAEALVAARRSLHEHDPASLLWSAPIHFSQRRLTFEAARRRVEPAPRGILRHLDILALDLVFEIAPLHCAYGLPLAGKSQLLETYRWWHAIRAGAPPPLLLDAVELGSPGALAERFNSGCGTAQVVLVDNAEHWADAPLEDWAPLVSSIGPGAGAGPRILLASRRLLAPGGNPLPGSFLAGLGGAGIRSAGERDDLARAVFAVPCAADPWLWLLIVATRGEPVLLQWTAERYRSGSSARALLWNLLFPSRETAASIGVDDALLAGVEPVLGWGFGNDARHLLASLALDPVEWESEAYQTLAAGHAERQAALAARGLTLPIFGHFTMPMTHSLLLRAMHPLDAFTDQEAARFAEFARYVRSAFWLADNAGLEDDFETLGEGPSAVNAATFKTVGPTRAKWATLLAGLPTSVAAATFASRAERAKALGDIAAGYARVLLEFEALAEARAWLDHWRLPMQVMAERGVSGSDYGLASIDEELERLRLVTGSEPAFDVGRSRLARLVGTGDIDGSDLEAQIRSVLARFDAGDAAAANHLLDELIYVMQLAGLGVAGGVTPALIEAVRSAAGTEAPLGSVLRLLVLEAFSHLHRGAADAANDAIERALALAERGSLPDRFAVQASASELWGATGSPRAVEAAQRCVHLAKQIGNTLAIGNAQLRLAVALAAVGEIEEAEHHCAEAIPKLASMAVYHLVALLSYAKISTARNDFLLAEEYRLRVESEARAQGLDMLLLEALALAPIYAFQNGAAEAAHASALTLRDEARARNQPSAEGVAWWILAEVAYEADDYAEAERCAREAVARIVPVIADAYSAYAHRVLARACLCQGRYGDACDAQMRAAELFDGHFNLDPVRRADAWIDLETIAFLAERSSIAIDANSRVEALLGGSAVRTPVQLAVTAVSWALLDDAERAIPRARQALEYELRVSDEMLEDLRRIAAAAP